MIAPESFVNSLERQFNGELRIRWSVAKSEWHIEQKFRRQRPPKGAVSEIDDRRIRSRDGYAFVAAIRPGDRMPCPQCGIEMKVPVMQFGEAHCDYCKVLGRRDAFAASYWPLSESLLEHLRKFDPYRDGIKRLAAEIESHEQKKEAGEKRTMSNLAEDIAHEEFTTFFNIPSVGYTGKEFKDGSYPSI